VGGPGFEFAFAYHDRDGAVNVTGLVGGLGEGWRRGVGAGLCLRYVVYSLPAK
jgi:hypothetical protein